MTLFKISPAVWQLSQVLPAAWVAPPPLASTSVAHPSR
jgi:hypothetical protein